MEPLNKTESLASMREANIEIEERAGQNSTVEAIKDKVADGLKSAAASLGQKSGQEGAMSDYAGRASSWLDSAGDYVREADVSQMKTDIQHQVRANPGRALLIAGAAGLVIGALFRRR